MELKYKKMSLFDAPPNSVLVHACNSQGVWGAGIAKVFKEKYPVSYKDYIEFCDDNNHDYRVGEALLCGQENKHKVGCLLTSVGFGKNVNTPSEILYNTVLSLEQFAKKKYSGCTSSWPIYSNKFNSGLFNVPWEDTEKFLKVLVEKYDSDWTVCDYE